MIKLIPIIPKRRPLDPRKQKAAIDRGMEDAKDGALKDFESTTSSWSTDVDFKVKRQKDGYLIGTDNKIWLFGDKGTKAHDIVATKIALRFPGGFRAKTRPGFIGSSGGGAIGAPVFRKKIHHPGTKARGWSKLIAKKWQSRIGLLVQKRISEAMRG
jgi:hypothetical protein